MDTLISNVTVVTMNEKMDVLFGAYIAIENGKIAYMGKSQSMVPAARSVYLASQSISWKMTL